MREDVRVKFENPDTFSRSFLFWAWNSRLEKEELVRQVQLMKEAGVGGFFIHSRDGLETEYLGEEWMDCVKAVVDEAEKLGLYAWLYDEDRWPSGTAGGRVTSQGDAYRCKGLTLEVCPPEQFLEIVRREGYFDNNEFHDQQLGLQAIYGARIQGMELVSCRRLDWNNCDAPKDEEVLLVVRLEVSAPSQWFNNEAPPDNLNPDCVRLFIEETHEKYKKEVGQAFGRSVPGIFTDEPSLHDRHAFFGEHKGWIPWTYEYSAYFVKQRGYDFFDVLPWVYFNGTFSRQARHDYWYVNTLRYGEAYFKTIGDWCEENHLMFTGHFLQEDKMGLCARVNGAVMPNYIYQHVPGIDMLCEQTKEYLTVKQCTSVAHQFGKQNVLTETYGCTGWDFSFEGQKWIGDWQYVLGVNHRSQHLALYTLKGCCKRDYPPSFNYNTNWWNKNKIIDDYFARLTTVLEEGVPVRRLLLLHPMSTVWSKLGTNPYGNPIRRNERDVPELNEYGDRYNQLIEYLEREHLDCDLGDELLIKEYGTAQDHKFIIQHGIYDAVIIPSMDTLFQSTCELLVRFMDQGGYVYMIKPLPYLVEGREQNLDILNCVIQHTNSQVLEGQEELTQVLNPYRSVSIEYVGGGQARELLCQLRKTDGGYFLFVVNNSRETAIVANIQMKVNGAVEEWKPLTGEIETYRFCENTGSGIVIHTNFAKAESKVFFIKEELVVEKILPERTQIRLSSQNVLPLDICRYCLEEEPFSEQMEVWKAQYQIRERLQMVQIHVNGLPQRYQWLPIPHPSDGKKVKLLFLFESDMEIQGAGLVLERMEEFQILFNGKVVNNRAEEWFLDRGFPMVGLPAIQKGTNTVELACNYSHHMELENIYITGVFGVTSQRIMTKQPETLAIGDWCEQGLMHYCGSVSYIYEYEYSTRFQRVELKVPEVSAVGMTIVINEMVIEVPWHMTEAIPITKYLREGGNRIEVELMGSPRNMMGPFHLKDENPERIYDACFCPEEEDYTEDYRLKNYGLMQNIMIRQSE